MSIDIIIFCILIMAIGYAICFYGYKLKDLMFTIVWFLLGFTISNQIFSSTFTQIDMLHAFSSIIGLFCSLLSYKLFLINIFVCVSWMIGSVLYDKLMFDSNINLVIAIIVGIILGLLAIKFIKPLLIIATSIIGSAIMVKGFSLLSIDIHQDLLLIIQIFITVLGLIYQFRTNREIDVEVIEEITD